MKRLLSCLFRDFRSAHLRFVVLATRSTNEHRNRLKRTPIVYQDFASDITLVSEYPINTQYFAFFHVFARCSTREREREGFFRWENRENDYTKITRFAPGTYPYSMLTGNKYFVGKKKKKPYPIVSNDVAKWRNAEIEMKRVKIDHCGDLSRENPVNTANSNY